MSHYEYRVIPAPTRGIKAKGLKSAEARFAHAVEETINTMAAEGWEYQRAETLPSTERAGLTSTTTTWRNLLVFRRSTQSAAAALQAAETQKDIAPASTPEESKDRPEVSETPKDTETEPSR